MKSAKKWLAIGSKFGRFFCLQHPAGLLCAVPSGGCKFHYFTSVSGKMKLATFNRIPG
jgi:hypothetical protein